MTTNDYTPAQGSYFKLNPDRPPAFMIEEEGWGARYYVWIMEEGEKGHNIAVDYLYGNVWRHAQSRRDDDPAAFIEAELTRMKAEWQETINRSLGEDGLSQVRFEHKIWSIGKEPTEQDLRERSFMFGYGGAKWEIEWLDTTRTPRTVITHNLWHGGDIPPALWEELPDNCTLRSLPKYPIKINNI